MMSGHWRFAAVLVLMLWPWPFQTQASSPQRPGGVVEGIPGVESIHGSLMTDDGLTLRTIVTRPQGASGRLPGLLFVQWLSCDSIALRETEQSGWSRMLRRLVQEAGFVVWRTDKAGVGGSEGDCSRLDYNTELAHHKQALAAFRRSPLVDPSRIVVFGASMGANMAPLVAGSQTVAGVMVWGGGARTWFERQLTFSRHAMELAGDNASQITARMNRHARFYVEYLLNQRSPAQIRAGDPALGSVWNDIVGTGTDDLHYGRSVQFHQQAQLQDWVGAWTRVTAPVLVLYGEYDWFEDTDAAQGVVRVVNRDGVERAELKVIPRMDHHFSQYASMKAAFREAGGIVNEGPAVDEMLRWLRRF